MTQTPSFLTNFDNLQSCLETNLNHTLTLPAISVGRFFTQRGTIVCNFYTRLVSDFPRFQQSMVQHLQCE
ncbi:MAG TPA: hypothetical protein DEB70_07090 [Planctomycetaceae bacterium]|nr:hypothetical protein [Planctomycetaceae bacterium]